LYVPEVLKGTAPGNETSVLQY